MEQARAGSDALGHPAPKTGVQTRLGGPTEDVTRVGRPGSRSLILSRRLRRGLPTDPLAHSCRNRLKTLVSSLETLLSKPLNGRLPQNVIEPVENTAPPEEVSK